MDICYEPSVITGRIYKDKNYKRDTPYVGIFNIMFLSEKDAYLFEFLMKEELNIKEVMADIFRYLILNYNIERLITERHGKMKILDIRKLLKTYECK